MIDFNNIGSNERQKNILMILNRIVVGQEASATDIAGATDLSFATISRALATLKKSGIVVTSGKEITDMGRHPDIFSVNRKYGYLLHFYVDAECIRGYLADFSGEIIRTQKIAIGRDITPELFAGKLRNCAEVLALAEKINYNKMMAAGIAIPGLVDETNKVVRRIPNFANFKNVNLFHVAEDVLKVPVIVNNEARLCAVGEYIHHFHDKSNLIYIDFTKYSGIGSGIILDGKLYAGKNGFAGEVGDMLVDVRGFENNYREDEGCLEAMAGVGVLFEKLYALIKRGRAGILKELMVMDETDTLNLRMIEQAVLMQDLDVMDVFDETMKMWAVAIINLSAMLDPDILILGGAVTDENDVVLARLKHYVSKLLYYDVDIVAGGAESHSQVLGGLYMLKKYVLNHMLASALF